MAALAKYGTRLLHPETRAAGCISLALRQARGHALATHGSRRSSSSPSSSSSSLSGLLRKDEVDVMAQQYESFLNDLEEDPDYRSNFNIYKGACVSRVEVN